MIINKTQKMNAHPKVFISYSHDNEPYKEWVRNFSNKLIENGVEVTLDQYDLLLADSNTLFMEKGISDNDFVIFLISTLLKGSPLSHKMCEEVPVFTKKTSLPSKTGFAI